MYNNFRKVERHAVGAALSDFLYSTGKQWVTRGTWQWGDELDTEFVSSVTTKWGVMRCFSCEPGETLWVIEYWEHDNGFRASFVEISVPEAKLLLAIFTEE